MILSGKVSTALTGQSLFLRNVFVLVIMPTHFTDMHTHIHT